MTAAPITSAGRVSPRGPRHRTFPKDCADGTLSRASCIICAVEGPPDGETPAEPRRSPREFTLPGARHNLLMPRNMRLSGLFESQEIQTEAYPPKQTARPHGRAL